MLSKHPSTELQLKSRLIIHSLWGMYRGYSACTGKELWDCPRSRTKWEKPKDYTLDYQATLLLFWLLLISMESSTVWSPSGEVYRSQSAARIIVSVAGPWKSRSPQPCLLLLEHSIWMLQVPSGFGEQPSSWDYTASQHLLLGQSWRWAFLN